MIDISRKLKNFGPLEALVLSSITYVVVMLLWTCLLYTSPSPRDRTRSRMPSSA